MGSLAAKRHGLTRRRRVKESATGLASLRVLVTHDWLVTWTGAERVLSEILALVPQADLVVGVRSDAMAHHNEIARRARETWIGRIPLARSHHRWFMPLNYAAFSRLDTRAYDLVISSSHAFAKAVRAPVGKPHVCYCHSPPRYLWDLAATYAENLEPLSAVALKLSTPVLRTLDRRSAKGVTHFVGNSRFVAARIKAAYDRDAQVVHPPVVPKPAVKRAREGFLLVLGRLVPYKRVDLAIQAAARLQIPLIIAGDGPDRARLERLAGPRTTFLGDVDESTAGDLMERCQAFVFCAEEDFGITPVEANAHGAPVVGYGRGGLLESMVPGCTAVFFDQQRVDDLTRAIEEARSASWNEEAIRANARRFSAARFRDELGGVLRSVVQSG
jgi:glycosyltransferase involved in cell wall biosynthesis